MTAKFCSQCGKEISPGSNFCNSCGVRTSSAGVSPKSPLVALLLCIFLGGLGIHRFYVGKIGTGILMLITAGGLGIWTLVDLVFIACSEFTDRNGNKLEFGRCSGFTLKKVLLVLGALLAAFLIFIGLLVATVWYATSGLVAVVDNQLNALRTNDYVKAYSYTSKDFQHGTSLNDFTRFVNAYPALKNNKTAAFSSREFQNDQGSLRGTLYSNDGAATPVKYDLIYENGGWKILLIVVNPGISDSQ